ncbi:MAG: hypothetical protein Sv326_1012 [Candidatus Fermentimicrarchaeum limneticum]|uniref:CARDB domain-containing protein n=1 Tax=Fermentimicrarchaeum limneticum TaxID=2795018 RepID=A0A7D5XQ53_FERL1|nr:MAG: hypothetical protein Sv326_1012 [Candidatus Fermentimicrarchaeum limneticum]
MKKYIIPFLLLVLLFGCLGSKPNLSVSFSKISPEHPCEGDVVTFDVTAANSGGAEAKDFAVELLVNNVSVKTEALTLAPNSNTTVSLLWTPLKAGVYEAVVRVDSGNVVSEPSAGKESSVQLSVAAPEELDPFSLAPSKSVINSALIDVNNAGLNAVYKYSATVNDIPQQFSFLKSYIKNLNEVKIATVDYNDSSSAIVVAARGGMSLEQMAVALSLLTNSRFMMENKSINGKTITVLTTANDSLPICLWREGGWTRALVYTNIFSFETCEDIAGRGYQSNSTELLSQTKELNEELPFNATLIGDTHHISNLTKVEYGAAFEDDEGFYGFYVTKAPYKPQNNTCQDRIANRSSMQLCESRPAGNSTWTLAERKVGDYSIICLSIPKSNEPTIDIEMKALDICYSFNFSGEERTWRGFLDMLHPSNCKFPDNFTCNSYDFSNSTLKLNLTQDTGRTVVLHGFKCSTEETTPTAYFNLNQSVVVPPNSSVNLEVPCYDEFGGVLQEVLVYFNSKMYLNYSFEGSNESKVITGNLTIRKI